MAIKFTIRKEKVIVDEKFFMFKEFVDIWHWDKSSQKPKAHKMLYFIFLLCDITETNPLRDIPAEKREAEALFYAYGKREHKFTKKELELLEPGIYCYIKYNTTSEERILIAFDNKAEEIRDVLDQTEPETVENETSGVVSFSSNTGIITKGLKEINDIKKLKVNVISAVRREAMSQKIRGQVQLSPLTKGAIELPSFIDKEDENEV